MYDFRVYRLDLNGHIQAASWEQAADLAGAIQIVREKHGNTDCEIWDGPKLLAKVPAASSALRLEQIGSV